MSSVGEPQRIIIVEPLVEPVPQELPDFQSNPVEVPEEEPVGV